MVQHLTNARYDSSATPEEQEKAWHILAVLLCIGRPVCPEELASKCGLFGVSPGYVRYLSSIPNSPLRLVSDRIVTVSAVALWAFKEFVEKVIGGPVLRNRIGFLGVQRAWDGDVRTYFRKRKGSAVDSIISSAAKRRLCLPCSSGEGEFIKSNFPNMVQDTLSEEPAGIANAPSLPSVNVAAMEFELENFNRDKLIAPMLLDSCTELSQFSAKDNGREPGSKIREVSSSVHTLNFRDSKLVFKKDVNICKPIKFGRVMAWNPDLHSALLSRFGNSVLCEKEQIADEGFTTTYCVEADENKASSVEAGMLDSRVCEVQLIEDARTKVEFARKGARLINSGTFDDPENYNPLNKPPKTDVALENGLISANPMNIITLEKDQIIRKAEFLLPGYSAYQKQANKSFGKLKSIHKNALHPQPRVLSELQTYNKVVESPKLQDQCKSDENFFTMKQKLKQSHKHHMQAKENLVDSTSPSPKVEDKAFPHFESFIVEDEEGSGGYGTVYRAQRKSDGKRFAIKCPHSNAHRHHVNNELKMLERFGGRNFIIKFVGTFKSGNDDCFILEYVEHDKPEVLKREIDIFELQWYGYCMFKALTCLHKQGVAHRDVKPGNFLFSRKLNKGYLIDFNLAMDLQKCAFGSKSKLKSCVTFEHAPLPHSKCAPLTKDKKLMRDGISSLKGGAKVDGPPTLQPGNTKKRTNADSLKAYPNSSGRNILKSQGGDGSGITSTKDATSTRTPSAERMREPVPSLGRKELINLVQGAMQSPAHDSVNILASQRKRVSAHPGNADGKIFYPSPMPLHSSGVAVAGAGLLKSKGDGKHKRDGPCVGTKGFRAPEVLFRSSHQGFKVDVWSAGVTLLYLMVGRTPFVGDPEQNIKDIAKLRGSEDLWEVAKLHSRESSFPTELFDIQSLPSVGVQEWCRINTKRLDLFKLIPGSLFDLVDKCLTVNPRLRISAEEALRHEFFAPCHESLRKQRMLRLQLTLDHASESSDQNSHLQHAESQASLIL
ncbi:uncharacterized protein LOC131166906 isoform X2 [Malania oleifera]|uniref:uncharacterized protein LOC131166906 isoform X2 n=1 Tax=Malania oleifera TaxID=397392 RepID=UPI0025ADD26D|nr:uncharacterized protein LOC131166906 isoform X2 [Malania oleifera]